MSSNIGGIQQTLQGGSNQGSIQAGVAGGNANVIQGNSNVIRQSNEVVSLEQEITQADALQLLEQLEVLLQTTELSEGLKRRAMQSLSFAKEEAQKTEPNKEWITSDLKRVTETLQATTETVVASQGLWQKLRPIFTQLAPWLGVAASLFLGSFGGV